MRNLSIDLRPSALDDLGLLPALRWYIKEYQQKCGIEVEFVAQSGLKERLLAGDGDRDSIASSKSR